MNRPVSVGNVRPMSGGNSSIPTPPPPPAPPTTEGLFPSIPNPFAGFGERFMEAFTPAIQNRLLAGDQPLMGITPTLGRDLATERASRTSTPFGGARGSSPEREPISQVPGMTFAEYAALFGGGGGGGASRPDFSAYRAALTEQAAGLNAQIQAMYNALAGEAGANVGRIQDIYGGAEQGIGNVYDSAAGNVADAFGSAQQQAADQMARLGIEAAAPAVIDPMALAQAQAVSGLEQGRASGQAAAQRFGASAGGFGSQMAQVAQQQGTETNAAILASLQNRLAESLAAEQTGGGGGGGRSMSVRDQLALRDAYNQDVLGQLTPDQIRQEQWGYEQNFRLNQAAAELAQSYLPQNRVATQQEQADALALATSILTR
jgi:hypothetical protein